MSENWVNGTQKFLRFLNSNNIPHYLRMDQILYELKQNPLLGNKVKRKLWPLCYVRRYGIVILFRVELANNWRLLYTVSKTGESTTVTVLEALSHGDYEDRFGY